MSEAAKISVYERTSELNMSQFVRAAISVLQGMMITSVTEPAVPFSETSHSEDAVLVCHEVGHAAATEILVPGTFAVS